MTTLDELKEVLDYDPETGVFRWKASISARAIEGREAGSMMQTGYRRICYQNRVFLAHRLAWAFVTGEMPMGEVDHINGDRSDNRMSNLRLATVQQNQANRKISKNNSAGFKGVWFCSEKGKFRAKIVVGGKRKLLGYFNTAEAAHKSYCEAAREHFGEFAREK
jgi:hypothetical protein